jgi:hypothetical protein
MHLAASEMLVPAEMHENPEVVHLSPEEGCLAAA